MPSRTGEVLAYLLKRLSFLCSAVYFITIPLHPFHGSAAIKGVSIGALAALAWISSSRLLWLALVASTVGDVLLDLDPGRLFVPGLCAFLAAHLVYTVLFTSRWGATLSRFIAMAVVIVYAAGFAVWLSPNLGDMTVPVVVYICAITMMVIAAIAARLPLFVPIGALLFLTSDSLLAIVKFHKASVPFRDYLVWGTYYAAQYFITAGVLNAPGSYGRNKRQAAA